MFAMFWIALDVFWPKYKRNILWDLLSDAPMLSDTLLDILEVSRRGDAGRIRTSSHA